jgi:hypothetical protein
MWLSKRPRLHLEQLEDRNLPSVYTASTAGDLIKDMNAANKAGGTNTITLAASTTFFTLTNGNNTVDGPTGLPIIAAGDNLTIAGNGNSIERSTVPGTAAFRLFDVANGAALTLENLTIADGMVSGPGVEAEGGAIYNQGTLVLDGVTVAQNSAVGTAGAAATKQKYAEPGGNASGGGIWSNGVLTLENGTRIENNTASGGQGGQGIRVLNPYFGGWDYINGSYGGAGYGGGVYVAGGSVRVSDATLSSNAAEGGSPGLGGDTWLWSGGGGLFVAGGTVNISNAFVTSNTAQYSRDNYGGGIYVAGGTVTLTNDSVASNAADGLSGGPSSGAGIYIATAASVSLDTYTVSHTINNTASTDSDIYGTYVLS